MILNDALTIAGNIGIGILTLAVFLGGSYVTGRVWAVIQPDNYKSLDYVGHGALAWMTISSVLLILSVLGAFVRACMFG